MMGDDDKLADLILDEMLEMLLTGNDNIVVIALESTSEVTKLITDLSYYC